MQKHSDSDADDDAAAATPDILLCYVRIVDVKCWMKVITSVKQTISLGLCIVVFVLVLIAHTFSAFCTEPKQV